MSNILYFDTIPSTNSYLKENYNGLNNLTGVVARHQTQGRGRLGRSWCDQDDLLMSILIKDKLDNYENLSLFIASIIFKVLNKYLNNIKIKWPNDLVVDNKKICGILLESVSSVTLDAIVVGFGINCNTIHYDNELLDVATSIYLETQNKVDIKKLSVEIYNEFIKEYDLFKNNKSDYLEINRNNSIVIGKMIEYIDSGEIKKGEVIDILDNGHLYIKIDNNYIEKKSGEISLHNSYGRNNK